MLYGIFIVKKSFKDIFYSVNNKISYLFNTIGYSIQFSISMFGRRAKCFTLPVTMIKLE